MEPLPRWTTSRRWLVLAGVLGPLVGAAILGLLAGLLLLDATFGVVYFGVVVVLWVLPRALVWRLTIVGTMLEHDENLLSVLDRRGEVRHTVDLRAVERVEAIRGDLVPHPFVKHAFSTAVAVWRDPDAEASEVVRTYLPFPDDFDAMVAFLREACEGSGCEVMDVTHASRRTSSAPDAQTPAAVTG